MLKDKLNMMKSLSSKIVAEVTSTRFSKTTMKGKNLSEPEPSVVSISY